jgi:DNA-binding transcriptional MerR regulator
MLTIGDFARLGQVSPRMLRHYDDIGLLQPARVDPQTGYRHYDVTQLRQLHRLLALRDLGFTLEQVRSMLDDDPPVEQLRGMLRLRRAQIEQDIAEEQARLRRVEAHLHALEGTITMSSLDVAIKTTDPVRVAEASATAPGFGSDNLGPAFERLIPHVLTHLERTGVKPGIQIAWYDEPADDGSVVLHAGFDIGDQSSPETEHVRVTELPRIKVASVVHRGSMDNVGTVYEALVRWIYDSGNELGGRSRELYHQWDYANPAAGVTELQMPVAS